MALNYKIARYPDCMGKMFDVYEVPLKNGKTLHIDINLVNAVGDPECQKLMISHEARAYGSEVAA